MKMSEQMIDDGQNSGRRSVESITRDGGGGADSNEASESGDQSID